MLSAFDGIGAAPWIVAEHFGRPLLAVSWEIDPDCTKVAEARMPWLLQRGDLFAEKLDDLVQLIDEKDPRKEAIVIWTAAPPCQDFSRVRPDGPGHSGERGGLFLKTVDFHRRLEHRLAGRPFGFIYENVQMTKDAAATVSTKLGVDPVLVCAGDFGWITRPRLWWSSIDWTKVEEPTKPFKWTVHEKTWRRLRLDQPRRDAASFDLEGLKFDDGVASGRLRMPCSTTPAPDEHGRPAPRSTEGKVAEEVQRRWLAGNRQYAPWHYRQEAMLVDKDGKLQLPTAAIKEQLHEIPRNYTAVDGIPDKTRHRLLGNGWHWGVAGRLIQLLVTSTVMTAATAQPIAPPRTSTLQWITQLSTGLPMGPRPPRQGEPLVPFDLDEDHHWEYSAKIRHPHFEWPQLEDGWTRLIALRRQWRHDLRRIRHEVLAEIKSMVDDGTEALAEWMSRRAPHVRATYSTPDKPRPTQTLVLLQLLEMVGYPAVDDLRRDLEDGFDMLGELRRGPGWRTREDTKYQNPSSIDDLRRANWEYLVAKLRTARVGEYTDTLLKELVDEAKLGRVVGPLRAPQSWPVQTVALPFVPGFDHLQPAPSTEPFVAASFPIIQADEKGEVKVRRGEDWRRSSHNATVRAFDVPTHHFVEDFVDLARVTSQEGQDLRLFGHDLLNAYRQWPVKSPEHSATILATEHGITLWMHHAMCFGAAASVWNFNRAADTLQQLLRTVLWLLVGHYVDDFNGVEFDELATHGFEAFADLFALLGLVTKASKAQAPAVGHVIQGVWMELHPDGVSLAPTERRLTKLDAMISAALEKDELVPHMAQKLAGKLSFLTQAVFGSLGKAAISPVYQTTGQQRRIAKPRTPSRRASDQPSSPSKGFSPR